MDQESFGPQQRALAPDYRLVCVDSRGHGLSEDDGTRSAIGTWPATPGRSPITRASSARWWAVSGTVRSPRSEWRCMSSVCSHHSVLLGTRTDIDGILTAPHKERAHSDALADANSPAMKGITA
ncbi:alpha/beta fold hydrolase [Nocardia acidivorans]|uniref:alpha/beta fold hydrolase n=1 Tax=Nocardia acidivorans TaxID=404580 RepID=UPI000833E276|nr:hypothetical protein [Nocardia acidivorans]